MSVKKAVLSALKSNPGNYISGEELSNSMNVSRTAVWKAISSLRKDGYNINAVTNKGYLLKDGDCTIDADALRNALPARYQNVELHIHDTLDSTNTYAKQLALEGAPHGSIVIAEHQTNGRGRLGRTFFSPRSGLYISIVIKPDFDLSQSVLVTSAAAVAVVNALNTVCSVDAGIKWVNDIYVKGKKVCGILSEGLTNFESGQIDSIIIGIGINTSVDGFPDDLLDIAGAVEGDYSRSALVANVIAETLDLMSSISNRAFMPAYKEKSLVIGKTVTVYNGKYKTSPEEDLPSRQARVLDIDDNGGLVVLYTDGSKEVLTSGEISVRL